MYTHKISQCLCRITVTDRTGVVQERSHSSRNLHTCHPAILPGCQQRQSISLFPLPCLCSPYISDLQALLSHSLCLTLNVSLLELPRFLLWKVIITLSDINHAVHNNLKSLLTVLSLSSALCKLHKAVRLAYSKSLQKFK